MLSSGVVGRINLLPKNMIQDLIKDLEKKTLCPTDDMYKFVDCLREKTMEEIVNTTRMHEYCHGPIVVQVFGPTNHNFPSKLDDPQKESRKYSSYN
jgi:hypothetical protein